MRNNKYSRHLFESPIYIVEKNKYFKSFDEALNACKDTLTIDHGALASYFSFGYVTGDRTIFNEIKRKPWLSKINNQDEIVLESIPKHDFKSDNFKSISERLQTLLLNEVRDAVADFDKVYVLLSGGLDSRIVAGLTNILYKKGEINNRPIAVTWGLEDSRDVVYAKTIANILDFDWKHIPITPEVVLENIKITGKYLGLIHSPELLHNVNWLNDNTDSNSIVLAGSFGDSIGRGEFGGIHLLKMDIPQITDDFGVLSDNVKNLGNKEVHNDIKTLNQRVCSEMNYMKNECFMQGYRMRNGLCHALTLVNKKSNIYQMFTSPEVFEFIWSIHPSSRGDEIYQNLLNDYYPKLASLPWARTNKALSGKTIGADKDLLKEYHLYTEWSRGVLRNNLESIIDIEWFEKTGLFNKQGLKNLKIIVSNSQHRIGRTNEFWLWLAGFKELIEYVLETGKNIEYNYVESSNSILKTVNNNSLKKIILKNIGRSKSLSALGKKLRKVKRDSEIKRYKKNFKIKHPPKPFDL